MNMKQYETFELRFGGDVLSDAWAQIRGNLENQDSKTALSAQLKLEGIGLFGRMIALRQGMGA